MPELDDLKAHGSHPKTRPSPTPPGPSAGGKTATAQGTVVRFAVRPVSDDLIQVVRVGVAVEARGPRGAASGEDPFDDVKREFIAWGVAIAPEATVAPFEGEWTADGVRGRVGQPPAGQWRARRLKAPRRRTNPPRPEPSWPLEWP